MKTSKNIYSDFERRFRYFLPTHFLIRKPRPQLILRGTTTSYTATTDTMTSALSPHLIFLLPFYLIHPPFSGVFFSFYEIPLKKMKASISFALLPNFISCVMRISYSLKFIDQDDMQTFFSGAFLK